jgi:protein-S-isoprenylcysteine O-methyltransferase Ste14
MQQTSALAAASTLEVRLKNLIASVGVVVLALAFHHISPQNRKFLARLYGSEGWSFTGEAFLRSAALFYCVLLALYFLTERDPRVSKSLRFWQLSKGFLRSPIKALRSPFSKEDRVAVLATLLKGLFGPLMTMALMTATMGFVTNILAVVDVSAWQVPFRELFDTRVFWLAFQVIVMVDVLVFTVGYLVELPSLGNRIRSVDPTLLGWAAALICYAPFNIVVGTFLGPPVPSEFPRFENSTLHFTLNFTLLGLMAVYSWASVALGFKASNLTHRGVVGHGPYRFVRHPAYACKNMAWWIGAIPVVTLAFQRSQWDGIEALASVVGWSMLYVLRAVTEEDHLRSVDGEYAVYAAKVRWRFIPGLI